MIDMAVEIDFLSVFSVGLLSSFSGLFFCLEKKNQVKFYVKLFGDGKSEIFNAIKVVFELL